MPIQEEPQVGSIYEDVEGKIFEVTGFDEDEGNIDIRYSDGTVDVIDIDAWYEMELQQVSSEDDWEGTAGHVDDPYGVEQEESDDYKDDEYDSDEPDQE